MDKIVKSPGEDLRGPDSLSADDGQEPEFKPLSQQEATTWRASQAPLSVWRVVMWQWVAVGAVGSLAWLLAGSVPAGLSAAYGGMSISLPSTLMAWGVKGSGLARALSAFARGSLAAVLFWEGVKVLLAVAMLSLAPLVVNKLNWLALVVGLVFVLKVYWFAFLVQSKAAK